jgi:N-acetylglucosamine-6-phosphate deacetylase
MNSGQLIARHFATGLPVELKWDNGVVHSVTEVPDGPADLWIAPALLDLQINGFAGVDFQQDGLSEQELLQAARGLRNAGCTRFLLTLITDDWQKLMQRLRHYRRLRESSPELQQALAGWHIEGPFLSPEPGYAGAHNPECMCNPRPQHIEELRSIAGNDPVMLTIAPERPGALAGIAQATALGITVSLGHTNASQEILTQAVKNGATSFTHLGNGCPNELNRFNNVLWRVFDTRGLTVSLIPDHIHVSPPLFRLVHKAIAPDFIYYTSDAMSAAGAPPGRYRLASLQLEVGEDKIVRYPGKPNFAGSALRPIDGVFLAANMLGCSWREVWSRFSETPARLMHLPVGLKRGDAADFCLLQVDEPNRLRSLEVFANGEKSLAG